MVGGAGSISWQHTKRRSRSQHAREDGERAPRCREGSRCRRRAGVIPMEYEFHPLANIFPLMTDEEIDALGEDMLKQGQREPIVLFEGMILDGRNRYNACLRKGIEP